METTSEHNKSSDGVKKENSSENIMTLVVDTNKVEKNKKGSKNPKRQMRETMNSITA